MAHDAPPRPGTSNDRSPAAGSLSRHFNASQLRLDTWNRLKDAARALDDAKSGRGTHGDASPARLRDRVEGALDTLEPIEVYWAFPGKDAVRLIRDLFERRETQVLANTVTYVVRMLGSDLYRADPSARIAASIDQQGSEAYFQRFDRYRGQGKDQHYFEVLFVDDLNPTEERGLRRRMLEMIPKDDRFVFDLVFAPSFEDALISVLLNPNIQSCIVRNTFPLRSPNGLEVLEPYLDGLPDFGVDGDLDSDIGVALGRVIKQLRPELDLFMVIDAAAEDIATIAHDDFRRVFYRQDDYNELYLSIRRGIMERYDTPFFFALKEYSQRPTGVFHAMPISRGNSISKSHWLQDMGDFFGRNIFLAETSATTGGLDSLLQPTGPMKKAQRLAARAFGARETFFVTNGTSTANKIVVQSLVRPNDIVLIDRDCHKSHHYGMVLAGANPVYLDSYPIEPYTMYGAVPLREIKRELLELKRAGELDRVKMLLLTNCTFDGLVYNVERVMEEVLAIKPDMVFLWDEAWFGFAGFTPTYRQRTAMSTSSRLHARYRTDAYRKRYEAHRKEREAHADDETWLLDNRLMPDPDRVRIRAYATHSTHKKLSSLRQGSMIHVWDEDFKRLTEASFHEAYMTHTSTSPSYPILASLDLARRQAELEGYEMVQKSVELAMALRARIAQHPLLRKHFRVLSLTDMIPPEHRESGLERYYDADDGWQRMEAAWRDDEFVLDPTHVTLYTGRTGIDGDTFKNEYLMDRFGIQINKTSRNSVLFMSNIGTTRSAIAYLISVLLKIARQLEDEQTSMSPAERARQQDRVQSLTEDVPPLPDFSRFHEAFRPRGDIPAGDIRAAYFRAYDEEQTEYLELDGSVQDAMDDGREVVSASFVIPYPPGFPILVPGQVISEAILTFMKKLDVTEIHGYRADLGLKVFTEDALRRAAASVTDKAAALQPGAPAAPAAAEEPAPARAAGAAKGKRRKQRRPAEPKATAPKATGPQPAEFQASEFPPTEGS